MLSTRQETNLIPMGLVPATGIQNRVTGDMASVVYSMTLLPQDVSDLIQKGGQANNGGL
jgi:hypothetical protein